MIKKLFLMQGVPGSGKSTIADYIAMAFNGLPLIVGGSVEITEKCKAERRAIILSTDHHWYHPTGAYEFNRELLAEMHRKTQQACISEMQAEREVIIIDNCNIKEWQARPYIEMAKVYEYSVTVVSVDCGLEEAIERQKDREEDRRVPAEDITKMYTEMERVLT